jgi:hypothetical protein
MLKFLQYHDHGRKRGKFVIVHTQEISNHSSKAN